MSSDQQHINKTVRVLKDSRLKPIELVCRQSSKNSVAVLQPCQDQRHYQSDKRLPADRATDAVKLRRSTAKHRETILVTCVNIADRDQSKLRGHAWPTQDWQNFHWWRLAKPAVDAYYCFVYFNVLFINLYFFWTQKRVSNGYERCCCSSFCCCYQNFHSLRLCRFSTDRNETFHTYQWQHFASSYRA